MNRPLASVCLLGINPCYATLRNRQRPQLTGRNAVYPESPPVYVAPWESVALVGFGSSGRPYVTLPAVGVGPKLPGCVCWTYVTQLWLCWTYVTQLFDDRLVSVTLEGGGSGTESRVQRGLLMTKLCLSVYCSSCRLFISA
jgi:hypothetical protein